MTIDTSILTDPGELHSHHIDRRAGRLAAEIASGGDPDELLSTSDVAELTGLSIQFFEIGRGRGYGPPFVRLSPRRVRYRRGDVVAWLHERTYSSTATHRDPGQAAESEARQQGRQRSRREAR